MPAELKSVRQGEPGLADRIGLERQVDQGPILVRARDGTDLERLRRASAEDDPFPPAGADEASGGVGEAAHAACPSAKASRAKAAFQPGRLLESDDLEAEVLHRRQGRTIGLVDQRRDVVPAPYAAQGSPGRRDGLRVRCGEPAPQGFGTPPLLTRALPGGGVEGR